MMHCGILINKAYFYCFQSSAISAIWPWLKTSIIPNVYPFRAYNGEILDYYNQQFIYNIDGLLLGPVRIKQNRDSIGKKFMSPHTFLVNMSRVWLRKQKKKYFGYWIWLWKFGYLVKWRQKLYGQANKAVVKSNICQNLYLTCGNSIHALICDGCTWKSPYPNIRCSSLV